MAKRLPKDFDIKKPQDAGLEIVDPIGAARQEAGLPIDREYPAHLVKPDLEGPGGPEHRELVVAADAAESKRYRAQGYMTHHEADLVERQAAGTKAARTAKPKAATKPANRKPKAAKPAVQ